MVDINKRDIRAWEKEKDLSIIKKDILELQKRNYHGTLTLTFLSGVLQPICKREETLKVK